MSLHILRYYLPSDMLYKLDLNAVKHIIWWISLSQPNQTYFAKLGFLLEVRNIVFIRLEVKNIHLCMVFKSRPFIRRRKLHEANTPHVQGLRPTTNYRKKSIENNTRPITTKHSKPQDSPTNATHLRCNSGGILDHFLDMSKVPTLMGRRQKFISSFKIATLLVIAIQTA